MRFVARNAVQRLDKQYAHLLKSGSMHQALTQTQEALAQSVLPECKMADPKTE